MVGRALELRRLSLRNSGKVFHSSGRAGASAAAAAAAPAKGLPLSAMDIFVLSAFAKIGATLVTYPLLVVKNRLQVCVPCVWGGGSFFCVCAAASGSRQCARGAATVPHHGALHSRTPATPLSVCRPLLRARVRVWLPLHAATVCRRPSTARRRPRCSTAACWTPCAACWPTRAWRAFTKVGRAAGKAPTLLLAPLRPGHFALQLCACVVSLPSLTAPCRRALRPPACLHVQPNTQACASSCCRPCWRRRF